MSTKNETGLLIARVLLGLMFLAFAFYKLKEMSVWTSEVERLGFWVPQAAAWIVAIVELVGGLMLVTGVKVREACTALGVILLIATIMHLRDYLKTEQDFQITNVLKNVGILGGLTALWASPGSKGSLVP